jgi:hypothetical protein
MSDGLPQWYHDCINDSGVMYELKKMVFDHLAVNENATIEEVISCCSIHPIFENEVEEFMSEWRG